MEQTKKETIEAALENPKEFMKLTREETVELYVLITQANSRNWFEHAKRELQEAQQKIEVSERFLST